jgi:chromate transporter
MSGANAAVVGVLLAALYDPISTSAVRSPLEFALALAAFGLLFFWRWPPLWVVAFAAAGGELLARFGAAT